MVFPSVTALYAGLFGLVLIYLSVQVIKQRMKHRVALLDGGVTPLQRAIRAHGNFCEYVPVFLILLLLVEISSYSVWILHLSGIIFLLGRISHFTSLIKVEPLSGAAGNTNIRYRQIGMMCSFGVIAMLSLLLLYGAAITM